MDGTDRVYFLRLNVDPYYGLWRICSLESSSGVSSVRIMRQIQPPVNRLNDDCPSVFAGYFRFCHFGPGAKPYENDSEVLYGQPVGAARSTGQGISSRAGCFSDPSVAVIERIIGHRFSSSHWKVGDRRLIQH